MLPSRGRRLPARAIAVVALTVLCVPVVGTAPSSASDQIGVAIVSTTNTQVQFSVCIKDAGLLPAHIDAYYSVLKEGTEVAVGAWSNPSPDSTLLAGPSCPYPYLIFAVNNLDDGTAYTITAQVAFTPKVSDDAGNMVDDPTRSLIAAADAVTTITSTSPFDPDDPTPVTAN
ncbi:MAG: hypothetical protein PSX37_10940, partial [bacterium]|nr:hypothetical protein [bacterium]